MDEVEKKLTVKVSAGLGNQMFMYANAFALSKIYGYKLFIDNKSGYFQKKNRTFGRKYTLNCFNLTAGISNYKYDNYIMHNYKKLLLILDFFKKNKSFLREATKVYKKTNYSKINQNFSKNLYIEGFYESEKYFSDFKSELIKEYTIKNEYINDNKFIKLLSSSNSVSIHIRRNRFIEPKNFIDKGLEPKKDIKLEDIINYIKNGVNYFKNKINNPKFFIWSNNFNDLDKVFNRNNFVFIENNNDINDFNLFKYSKHFIVSPSTYHWWGAWLNQNPDKICLRPPDSLNPSNNEDFWPNSWTKI